MSVAMPVQAKDLEGFENIKKTVESSNLYPIEHEILSDTFLALSGDPEAAASEVRRRILASPGAPIEQVLRQLKADWRTVIRKALEQNAVSKELAALLVRRDQGRCCISPRHCAQLIDPIPDYLVSPSIEPLLQHGNEDPEARLLQAFISPKRVPYLRTAVSPNKANTSNAWLLSPGLGLAIRQGQLRMQVASTTPNLDKEPVSMEATKTIRFFGLPCDPNLHYCDGTPLPMRQMSEARLSTDSPSETPLPSPYLVQLQRVFAEASKQFSVEKECAQPWPERQAPSKSDSLEFILELAPFYLTGRLLEFWNRSWLLFFRRLWHFVPKYFRTWAYRRMLGSCKHVRVEQMYESPSAGLIAKRDMGNEAAALALLEAKAPGVPAPLLIDTFEDGDGNSIVVMTQIPGVPAITVLYRMTYQERRQFADDLAAAITHMRQIPNDSRYLFTGLSKIRNNGSKIYDPQVGDEPCGPFENEWEWNMSMTGGTLDHWRASHPEAFLSEHESRLTHADLHLDNILVDAGKLSGIIDWEISGFYPEYWEFSKAMYAGRHYRLSHPIHRQIWQGKYEAESDLVKALISAFVFGPPPMNEK